MRPQQLQMIGMAALVLMGRATLAQTRDTERQQPPASVAPGARAPGQSAVTAGPDGFTVVAVCGSGLFDSGGRS